MENVVDASGEADVAYRSGVPCITKPSANTTFGLLIRLGNVDVDKFLQYFFNLDAGKHNPEFIGWLSRHLGLSAEELRQDRYWRYFLDPQICQSPIIPPQPRTFNAEALRWFRERWEEDGYFAYINMHFFRDLLRQAVENGDLQLKKKISGIGEIGFNFDGFSGGRWRRGQVVLNGIMPMNGFDAFNSEHITKVEITSRKRAFEILTFLKKYLPGFEKSYIMDTGFQTMPRHPRMIEGEYKLTMEDIENSESFYDAIYSAAGGENWLPHQVPYRMLLPKKIDNLLVAGKCASGAIYARSIPHAMAQGHAAGTAAALASIKRVPPRQIGIKDLQEILREQGLIIDIPV